MTAGIGTPLYQAPEVIHRSEGYTSAVDVFAFAIILWEMVTEQLVNMTVYKGMNNFRIGEFVRSGKRPAFPASVNPRTMKLIADCWDQNPRSRPPFKEILRTLMDMNYQIKAGVDSAKVAEFVQQVVDKELAVSKN
jgi:serine/threonine protein kinase